MKKYRLLSALITIVTVALAAVTSASAQFDNGQTSADLNGGAILQSSGPTTAGQKKPQLHPQAYYFTSSGKRLQFRVHPDIFMLTPTKAGVKKSSVKMARLASNLQAGFGRDLVMKEDARLKGKIRAQVKAGKDHRAIFNRLRKKSNIDYISPLLLNEHGGEVALSPGVIIRFVDTGPVAAGLLAQLSAEGLTLQKPLDFTEHEHLFRYAGLVEDPTGLFEATRAAMAMAEVEWAEPNFEVAPQKSFTPNDTLYANQWHLNNTGQNGAQPGADVNAAAGWELSRATRTVVAIVDDGVESAHPDLPIWNNPGETGGGKETDGIDNDGNGYIDDFRGWDFGDADNNPDPATATDNHGTSVAGVAAAQGDNGIGVSGSASNATILPVRTGAMSCADFGNALRYAAKYGDVVNNSWGISACQTEIDSAIADAVAGVIPGSRRGDKGTPVLFATGNSASGWRRFTLSGVPAGTHLFEWEYDKDFSLSDGYDTMWLDDVAFPGGFVEDFESGLGGWTSTGNANWILASDGVHARGGSGNSARAGAISNNQKTIITTTRTVAAGNLTFWAWVSSEQNYDKFNLYVTLGGGNRQGPFFGFSPGQNGHLNEVGYPSSNPNAISIGASNDGGPSGLEERSDYSQFGPALDVLAPSNGGNQGITTTDRLGANGYDAASDYTSTFGGTSSATPTAAGVVADIIGIYPHITAAQLRDALRNGADPIGPYTYPTGRNDHYGYGRINLLGSLDWIKANNLNFDCDLSEKLIADRWALIGLPCLSDLPGTVLSTLGDDLDISLRGIDWVIGEKRLVGINNYTTLVDGSAVDPGRGYWVKSILGGAPSGSFLDSGALDVQGTETPVPTANPFCPSANGCFVIDLNPPATGSPYEWNMVAHPLAFAVDWADVRILVDNFDVYVPSAAEAADIVSATYQVWNGATYSPKDDITPGMVGTLEPGQGFWVKTLPGSINKTVQLLIPAIPTLTSGQVAEELPWFVQAFDWLLSSAYARSNADDDRNYTIGYVERAEAQAASDQRIEQGTDWYVRLSVEAPEAQLEDTGNVLGQLADSVAGYDSHDLQERQPFSTPYLMLVFPHRDWGDASGDYASDYRKPGGTDKWIFELRTDEPGRKVNLCWEGSGNIIAKSVLVDIGSKKRHRLKRKQYKYGCLAVVMDETVKRFRWVYK